MAGVFDFVNSQVFQYLLPCFARPTVVYCVLCTVVCGVEKCSSNVFMTSGIFPNRAAGIGFTIRFMIIMIGDAAAAMTSDLENV